MIGIGINLWQRLVSAAAAGSTLLNGLVSYWALDEVSGVRYDSHGSNDLTDNNTVGSVSTGPLGTVGSFVAANSESLSSPDLFFAGHVDGFSVGGWVKWSAADTFVPIHLSVSSTGADGGRWAAVYSYAGTIGWEVEGAGPQDSGVPVVVGAWYHALITYDGTTARLYVNGVEVDQYVAAAAGSTNMYMHIGKLGAFYHQGSVGVVGLWDRVLASDERTSLFASGNGLKYADLPAGLLTGLVSYWNLDEVSGVRYDSHSTNDLTDNNTVGSVINAGDAMNGVAASFVAANSEYLSVAQTAPLTFTVSAWVRHAAVTDKYGTVLAFKNGVGGHLMFGVNSSVYGDSNFASLAIYDATNWFWAGGWRYPQGDPASWHHIVGTCDNDTKELKVYLDGTQVGTTVSFAATPGDYAVADEFRLGKRGLNPYPADDTAGWNPNIDEVAIWDRVLTEEERAELFRLGAGKFYPFE